VESFDGPKSEARYHAIRSFVASMPPVTNVYGAYSLRRFGELGPPVETERRALGADLMSVTVAQSFTTSASGRFDCEVTTSRVVADTVVIDKPIYLMTARMIREGITAATPEAMRGLNELHAADYDIPGALPIQIQADAVQVQARQATLSAIRCVYFRVSNVSVVCTFPSSFGQDDLVFER
jgi:hypothetical protein